MPDYTPPLGVPAARKVVCYADWTKPHGVQHNRVCVCQCQWCKRERAMLAELPAQCDLFTNPIDTPPPQV